MDSQEKILDSTFSDAVSFAKKELYRDMPWRHAFNGSFDPYKILVSEVMLQQTQVSRVIQKYQAFITYFPTVHDLADAQLSDVLRLWSGLGYNRRAKYLYDAAKILSQSSSIWSYDMLVSCKGIGPNTAKAVLVYAQNKPEVFIETNIRSVILYYMFSKSQEKVTDKQILEIVSNELDTLNPRTWYWALMDLGAYIKQNRKDTLHKAHSHKKQTKFEGSKRQIRGKVLQLLGTSKKLSIFDLRQAISDPRLTEVISDLEHESLISLKNNTYYLGT